MEGSTPVAQLRNSSSNGSHESNTSAQSLSAAFDKNTQEDEVSNGFDSFRDKWDPKHFESLTTLGKGNYATVYLVQSLQTEQLYAMKVKSKRTLEMNSALESVRTEKAILLLAKKEKHPFVVEVFGGYQTQSHVMIFLEFCQGGDLLQLVRTGGPFNTARAR
jgi:serine/threonine protein kinase